MTTPRIWLLRTLLLVPLVPLVAGRRMVTYQDAIMTHLPAKAASSWVRSTVRASR